MVDIQKLFKGYFEEAPLYYLDTGGRLEIVGNHTDHNHGLCLVANCSLRMVSAIKPTDDNKVTVLSEGYPEFSFDISDLSKKESEEGKPIAILKGTMSKLSELGYKIGGFKMYMVSEVPNGSGVSSSAALEALFGYTISHVFNEGKIPAIIIAKTGQYAENCYFNKPCGLLDQIGTSFDSSNFIDFKDIENPTVDTLPFNLPLSIFLIKSEGNHSQLTPLYKAIPDAMYEVANLLENDKHCLGDLEDTSRIIDRIDELKVGDSVKRKAKHFFIENENVLKARRAIKENNVDAFLEAVRLSQESSKNGIENTFVKGEYLGSPQYIIDTITPIINGSGAVRIHGGGFKGTVIAFMKKEFHDEFKNYCDKHYKNAYFEVSISPKACNFYKFED